MIRQIYCSAIETWIVLVVFMAAMVYSPSLSQAEDAVPRHISVSPDSTEAKPHAVGFDVIPADKELHLYLEIAAPKKILTSNVETGMGTLWKLLPENKSDQSHKWLTQDATTDKKFAAMFNGTLEIPGTGPGGGAGNQGQPPTFWVQTSDIDIDADSDNSYDMAGTPPRRSPAVQQAARDLEDKYESASADGSSNGNGCMVMKIGEDWAYVELKLHAKVAGTLNVTSSDVTKLDIKTTTMQPVPANEAVAAGEITRTYIMKPVTTERTTTPVTVSAVYQPSADARTGTQVGAIRDDILVNIVEGNVVTLAIHNTYDIDDDFVLKDGYVPVMVTWTDAPDSAARTVNLRETDANGDEKASGATIAFYTKSGTTYTAVTSVQMGLVGGTLVRQVQVYLKGTALSDTANDKHIRGFVVDNASNNSVKCDLTVVAVSSIDVFKPTTTTWADGDKLSWANVIFRGDSLKAKIVTTKVGFPAAKAANACLGLLAQTRNDATSADPWSAVQLDATNTTLEAQGLESRIVIAGSAIIALGLLPGNGEDGINEFATADKVDNRRHAGSNYNDSNGFDADMSAALYKRRGKARTSLDTGGTDGNISASPPESPVNVDYVKAGGVVFLQLKCGTQTSEIRQIQNQADMLYLSGHGDHATGKLLSGTVGPTDVTASWQDDLYVAIFAGCAVLDIGDDNNNYAGAEHNASPGTAWAATKVPFLCGYDWVAPLDDNVGNANFTKGIVDKFCQKWQGPTNRVLCWMNANKEAATDNDRTKPGGRPWNACVIANSETKTLYYWFDFNKLVDGKPTLNFK